ncbi:unnamed protein product [Ambrosiozyma monospora]|uniref:Unnamed protein product n=1 Tax=Ambrosiozyma monospora TaxID=43982 RepID=A0A9W6Z3H0_AMBMO|nr:unnamed protein product [Ambrosiozyma monospora]
MFYHIHNPKINPYEYLIKDRFTDPDMKFLRNYGDEFPNMGFDIESWIWSTVKEELCEKDMFHFSCFKDHPIETICDNANLTKRNEWLKETGEQMIQEYQEPQFTPLTTLSEQEREETEQFIFDHISSSSNYHYKDE